MKRFTIPALYDLSEHRESFSENNSVVYPWTNSRFIVQLQKYYHGYNPHDVFSWFQLYVAGQELEIVIRSKHQLPNEVCDFTSLRADQCNIKFYLPCSNFNDKTKVLDFPELTDSGKSIGKLLRPFGGKRCVRVGNCALISGYQFESTNEQEILNIFLKGIQLHRSEIAEIYFNGFSYSVKVMKFARNWMGSVLSMAISLDKLTACALIGYQYEDWEVVIWDLEV